MQGFFGRCGAAKGEAIVTGEVRAIRLELKYCEACGALWLRPRSSNAPYCTRCEKVMAELCRTNRMDGRHKAAEGKRP